MSMSMSVVMSMVIVVMSMVIVAVVMVVVRGMIWLYVAMEMLLLRMIVLFVKKVMGMMVSRLILVGSNGCLCIGLLYMYSHHGVNHGFIGKRAD